ncbi:phosphodiester glycosidase family protein [Paenibacillus lautus]|uniref:phosphodiester glycosidase family protein n=1 Tax=Paenibacillus lautus TaxID=1401 RepID=UPI003D2BDA93
MAQAKYYNSTIGGKTVHYIAADPEAINVEDLGGAVLSSSSKFGINGTFFDDKLKKVFGIACTQFGHSVREAGSSAVYQRGTMVCLQQNANAAHELGVYQLLQIADLPNKHGISPNYIKWAISGLGLYLNDSSIIDSKTLTKRLVDNEHGQSVNAVSPAANSDRAAIGYNSSTKKVILANILNATPWDVRVVMKSLNCSSAVMLDGSSATQLRAKKADQTVVKNGGGRNIYSIVTVNATWV